MARERRNVVSFPTREAWDAWLAEHHGDADGVWMKIAKKGSGVETVRYPDVLDVALSWGWIDGQRDKLDDTYFLQRFTPRRRASRWSKVNRAKAEELIARGEMKPPGMREVERAKSDGRWDAAYEAQSRATVPEDLKRELDKDPRAREFFESLNSQNRYAILYRLHDAKRPETRARRLEQFVAMLKERRKIY